MTSKTCSPTKALKIGLVIMLQFFLIAPSFGITEKKNMASQFKENKADAFAAKAWAAESIAATTTAYDMSMPLLANPALYTEKAAKRFDALLKETYSEEYKNDAKKQWMTSDEFRLWMRGRQLLVAMKAGQADRAADIAKSMQVALKPESYNPQSDVYNSNTAFACWSLGYLTAYYALHDEAAYEKSKDELNKSVEYQKKHYEKPKGSSRSDVMWSYAMAIQASAWAKDETSYKHYMQGLAELSGKNSTPAASIQKLPDDQFPAWLASIVHGSALLRRDPQAGAIGRSLQDARERSTQIQDKMLSESTQADYYALSFSKTHSEVGAPKTEETSARVVPRAKL